MSKNGVSFAVYSSKVNEKKRTFGEREMHKKKVLTHNCDTHTYTTTKKKKLCFSFFLLEFVGPLSPIVVLFPEVSILSYHHCTGRRILTTFPFFVVLDVLLLCAFMFFVFSSFFSLYKVQVFFLAPTNQSPVPSSIIIIYYYLCFAVCFGLLPYSALSSPTFTFFIYNVLPFFFRFCFCF